MAVCVMALGSPHGDDRVAWEAVARAKLLLPVDTQVIATADPLELASLDGRWDALVIVDASRGGGPPGYVRRFDWPDPLLPANRPVSSHGVGLVEALQLAEFLGRLPVRVTLLTVEVESAKPGTALSETVAAAVDELAARIVAEIGSVFALSERQ